MTIIGNARRGALALAVALALPALAAAQDTAIVARVGDSTITEADIRQAETDFAQELAQVPAERRRGILIDVLVDMELLAQAAVEKGLDKTEDFARRLEFLRTRALRNTFVEKEIVASLTPEEVKAEYDAEIAKFEPQEEMRARHILVETKEEAEKIIKELEGGADFAAIAKERSKDPGSGANGGDLGFFGRGQMVPAFEEAALALQPGAVTKEPVQSQFGWHVIKLEEKRMSAPPPLAEVEEQVRGALLRRKFEAVMGELRARIPVEIVGAADKPAETPADGAAGQPSGGAAETPATTPEKPAEGGAPAEGSKQN